ncbi:MAG: Gfo/Idh/MocA family oxidoreductase [Clostridiales bacterium]|nr:Gfo/Idh/MocA family oxidoreductase [Clostridiales bacterium]
MDKLRLGLVGCGGMMRTHAAGINLAESVEIVAVCDIIRERAEDVAQALNSPYITTDYETMAYKVDAVLVALPHDLHYECGAFFAANKKHVMMEKPLCNTEEECLSLIDICDRNGVTLMCAYPVRFWPGIAKLKELIDSGEFGQVIQMSVWTEQLTGENLQDLKHPNWMLTGRLGGGQFFSHGCHYVDLMLWFLGNPVKGVHIGTRNGTPWMMREGTSAAVIEFENGSIGYHGATWGARGTRLGYDFQIQTEKGMLEYDHFTGMVRHYHAAAAHVPGGIEHGRYDILWERGKNESAGKLTHIEIEHFAECVRTGKTPVTDGRAALQGLRVIWAMYDAERHNTMADLRGMGLPESSYRKI